MVDKNISEAVRDAGGAVDASAASTSGDTTREYVNRGYNAARDYVGGARDYANKGYDAARDYANAGLDAAARAGENLTEFVRKEPWIAVVAAFAVGYLAARVVRRLSI